MKHHSRAILLALLMPHASVFAGQAEETAAQVMKIYDGVEGVNPPGVVCGLPSLGTLAPLPDVLDVDKAREVKPAKLSGTHDDGRKDRLGLVVWHAILSLSAPVWLPVKMFLTGLRSGWLDAPGFGSVIAKVIWAAGSAVVGVLTAAVFLPAAMVGIHLRNAVGHAVSADFQENHLDSLTKTNYWSWDYRP